MFEGVVVGGCSGLVKLGGLAVQAAGSAVVAGQYPLGYPATRLFCNDHTSKWFYPRFYFVHDLKPRMKIFPNF